MVIKAFHKTLYVMLYFKVRGRAVIGYTESVTYNTFRFL